MSNYLFIFEHGELGLADTYTKLDIILCANTYTRLIDLKNLTELGLSMSEDDAHKPDEERVYIEEWCPIEKCTLEETEYGEKYSYAEGWI